MDLRRLDDRVLARAAARVRVRRLGEVAAASPGAAVLPRRLDERCASTGALRVVRDAHLAAAHERTVRLARQTPGTRRLALVSLRDELTVEQTGRLVAGRLVAGSRLRRKAEEQRELLALAAGAARPARASDEAAAGTAGQEAAYAEDCACVLALVLEGPAAGLAALVSQPAVRGVEVAPAGSRLAATSVTPLGPGTTGPVPAEVGRR